LIFDVLPSHSDFVLTPPRGGLKSESLASGAGYERLIR
jgi:hypothetical protein